MTLKELKEKHPEVISQLTEEILKEFEISEEIKEKDEKILQLTEEVGGKSAKIDEISEEIKEKDEKILQLTEELCTEKEKAVVLEDKVKEFRDKEIKAIASSVITEEVSGLKFSQKIKDLVIRPYVEKNLETELAEEIADAEKEIQSRVKLLIEEKSQEVKTIIAGSKNPLTSGTGEIRDDLKGKEKRENLQEEIEDEFDRKISQSLGN
jgi:uncharacterized protein YoxC